MDEADVQHRARAFVSGVDTTNICVDLSPYVNAINGKLVTEKLNAGESGYTLTKPNGKHIITVNSLETEERQRFTICHELAHIVLGLPSKHEEVPSWSYAKRDPNEVMCDLFAAELLMPHKMWREKVPQEEPSIEVIEYLAAEFRASFPAAASRFASLAEIPCAFVTMEKGLVRYAARSTLLRQVNAWISPRSPIPSGSVAHRLREEGLSLYATEEVAQDIWFENWEKGLDMWELARHYSKFDTSISLLWFSEEDLPAVEISRFGTKIQDDGGLPELTGDLPWPSGKKRR